ncbi:MAG: hypothetical protein ABL909_06285 [Sphingopyxis sp.]
MFSFPEKCYVHADFEIHSEFSLEDTAEKLQRIFQTEKFVDDYSYDEYPAFSSVVGGVKIALLGIPPVDLQVTDEPVDTYQIIVRNVSMDEGNNFDVSSLMIEEITASRLLKCI